MAVLIPDTPRNCGFGERQVFERIERDLDDDNWVVLHSLGLVHHDHKLWGEIDFALLTTRGIFVIEVKGGKVSCKDGKWIHEMAGRDPYVRNESPWRQAKDAMFALQKEIKRLAPDLGNLLFGYGVVMPHEVFATVGPEIEAGVLLDKRNFRRNLGFYIGDLQRFWETTYHERHGDVPRPPTPVEIKRLRQILRPDIDATFSLGSYLNGLEEELIQLTNQQVKVSRRMAANPRSIVRGRAGTGKTVLAVERARQLASEGLSVLYLCYNQLLARHVETGLRTDSVGSRIRVSHAHALYRKIIESAGLSGELASADDGSQEFYAITFPAIFVEAALLTEPAQVDVLVIDEGQDLLTLGHLDAFDLLLRDGLRRGRWHIFLDPLQNIYGKFTEDAELQLGESGYTADDLFENCRNTRMVATQTSIISGIEMAIEGAIPGPNCECVFYRDRDDFLMKLNRVVSELLGSDVPPKDIIALSPRRLANSLLADVTTVGGLALRPIADAGENRVLSFSTMQAFKGLERRVVLAIDLHIENEALSMLHYCGLSRAQLILRPFLPESSRRAYENLASRFGGSLLNG